VYSPRLRCLDFEWSILSNDSDLVDRIAYLYEPCVVGSAGPARHMFLVRRHAGVQSGLVSVHRDDQAVLRRAPEDLAVAQVAWEVNRGVVEEPGHRLLLHAAAAERDGKTVVLAGPKGSGKSTLVDALVRAGLRYVTDETVALDLATATIASYPKPIALHGRDGQRLVSVQAIRRDAVARSSSDPRLLMLLGGYQRGQATAARPVPRAAAVVALTKQAFNFRDIGPGRLGTMAQFAQACECYRLEVGDLQEGRDVVLGLLDEALAG
jgi:hypothetical protein